MSTTLETERIISRLANATRCFWCDDMLCSGPSGEVPRGTDAFRKMRTRDHLISRRHGGRYTVWSCRDCNELKGSMSPDDFRQEYRPLVSPEIFAAALAQATKKQIKPFCPVIARWHRERRRQKLSRRRAREQAYYDGAYVIGYSSAAELPRALATFASRAEERLRSNILTACDGGLPGPN